MRSARRSPKKGRTTNRRIRLRTSRSRAGARKTGRRADGGRDNAGARAPQPFPSRRRAAGKTCELVIMDSFGRTMCPRGDSGRGRGIAQVLATTARPRQRCAAPPQSPKPPPARPRSLGKKASTGERLCSGNHRTHERIKIHHRVELASKRQKDDCIRRTDVRYVFRATSSPVRRSAHATGASSISSHLDDSWIAEKPGSSPTPGRSATSRPKRCASRAMFYRIPAQITPRPDRANPGASVSVG